MYHNLKLAEQNVNICIAGANVNAIMNHTSSLHMAAQNKDADLVELLLEYGANIYGRNNQHKTPMDFLMDADCKARKVLEFHMSKFILVWF